MVPTQVGLKTEGCYFAIKSTTSYKLPKLEPHRNRHEACTRGKYPAVLRVRSKGCLDKIRSHMETARQSNTCSAFQAACSVQQPSLHVDYVHHGTRHVETLLLPPAPTHDTVTTPFTVAFVNYTDIQATCGIPLFDCLILLSVSLCAHVYGSNCN